MIIRVPLVLAVLTGGLFADACRTLYACIAYGLCGATPFGNLESIAGGILGPAVHRGDLESVAIGLLFHVLVLAAAAALLHAAIDRSGPSARHAIVAGLLCGACIYAATTAFVVPRFASLHQADAATAGRCPEFIGPHGIRWSPNRLV